MAEGRSTVSSSAKEILRPSNLCPARLSLGWSDLSIGLWVDGGTGTPSSILAKLFVWLWYCGTRDSWYRSVTECRIHRGQEIMILYHSWSTKDPKFLMRAWTELSLSSNFEMGCSDHFICGLQKSLHLIVLSHFTSAKVRRWQDRWKKIMFTYQKTGCRRCWGHRQGTQILFTPIIVLTICLA